MRVCFDGLCFANRRPAVVDVETQTQPYSHSLALDGVILNDTGGTYSLDYHQPQQLTLLDTGPSKVNASNKNSQVLSSTRSKIASIFSFTTAEKRIFFTKNHNKMEQDQMHQPLSPRNEATEPRFAAAPAANLDTSSFINNNMITTCVENSDGDAGVKMDTVQSTDSNSNEVNMSNVYPSSPPLNERIVSLRMDKEGTVNEEQLLQVIQIKAQRIQELEIMLRQKDNEIAELKSHLDKFQSVFPFSRGRKSGAQGVNGQRQRAPGISAEPQSESSVLELLHVTFPKYDKDERWVKSILFALLLLV